MRCTAWSSFSIICCPPANIIGFCLRFRSAIESLRTATVAGFPHGVREIEKGAKVVQFTFQIQETTRVNQIALAVQHHSNHLIAAVARDKVPKTFATLRIRTVSLPFESLDNAFPACTFYVRAQGGTGSWETGSARRGAMVNTDAYVNRLKRACTLRRRWL